MAPSVDLKERKLTHLHRRKFDYLGTTANFGWRSFLLYLGRESERLGKAIAVGPIQALIVLVPRYGLIHCPPIYFPLKKSQ